jgi:polysaccharide biosynthesis transport protein
MNAEIPAAGQRITESSDGQFDALADSNEFDLRVILMFLRRRATMILLVAVAVFAVVLAVTTQLVPRYEATATVLIDLTSAQVVDIEAVISGVGTGASRANAQTAILKSRAIAQRVAERLNLWEAVDFNIGASNSSSRFNPLNWFGETEEVGDPEVLLNLKRESVMSVLRANMSVSSNTQTQTIDISYTSQSPQRAAEIANTIANEYALDQLEAKFEATKNAADWLSRRLEGMRVSLDASERAVEIYRSENNLINADGLLLNEQELSELNSQLILIRAEKAEKRAIYSRAQHMLAGGAALDSVSEVIQSPVIAALRQQQAELARKQADFSSRYGARHPQMLNVQAERRDLDAHIQQEIRRIVDSLKNAVAVVETRERSIERSLDERRSFAAENNQSLVNLRALEREAEATRSLYETFLARFKEVNAQESLQTSGVRVISRATAPLTHSFPKTNMILFAALVVGLGLGAALAFVLELLDDSFHTTKQLEAMTLVPNIAVVPLVEGDGAKGGTVKYMLGSPLSPYAEAFRGMRTSLALSNVDTPPKVVLFTSAIPSEGKTTISTSFALAAARAGQKVIVVDCDLRKPSVHKMFDVVPDGKGLVEHLADPKGLEMVVQTHTASGTDFIPVVSGSINPTDLLASQHMADLIQTLRNKYDLVVIDSAPLLPVADTRSVAGLADTTVLVVRWGRTPRAAALNASNLLRQSGLRLAGTVLSAVDMAQQSTYGYGDTAYAYGNYGDYYAS